VHHEGISRVRTLCSQFRHARVCVLGPRSVPFPEPAETQSETQSDHTFAVSLNPKNTAPHA
jgi:hypothetical protein